MTRRGDAGLDLVVADGELPQLMGGSLVYEPERGTVMAIGRAYGQPLHGGQRWLLLPIGPFAGCGGAGSGCISAGL